MVASDRQAGVRTGFHTLANFITPNDPYVTPRPDPSLEDAEWLLARAAGFHAGFALAASLASTAQLEADPDSADAAKQFGATPAILAAIREWEAARLAQAFPPEVRAALRDHSREFHLARFGEGRWHLFEFHVQEATHALKQDGTTEIRFANPHSPQPLEWIVRNGGGQPLAAFTLQVAGRPALSLDKQVVPPGGALRYAGGAHAAICDGAWREVGSVAVNADAMRLGRGPHDVTVGCRPQPEGELKLELRTRTAPIAIVAR